MPTSTDRWEKSRTGAVGELLVAARLGELGFEIFWAANKASAGLDFICSYNGHLNRIQIKTKFVPRTNATGQDVKCGSDPKMYDYLICYLHHHHATYVVPSDVPKKKNLTFYPDGLTSKVNENYEEYRDAWHLLRTGG